MKRQRFYWPLSHDSSGEEEVYSASPGVYRNQGSESGTEVDSSAASTTGSSSSETSSDSGIGSLSNSSDSCNSSSSSSDGGGGGGSGDNLKGVANGNSQLWRHGSGHGAGAHDQVEDSASNSGSRTSNQAQRQGEKEKEGRKEEEQKEEERGEKEVSRQQWKRIKHRFGATLFGRSIPKVSRRREEHADWVRRREKKKIVSLMDALCFLTIQEMIWMGEDSLSIQSLREKYSETFFFLGKNFQDIWMKPSQHSVFHFPENLEKEDGGSDKDISSLQRRGGEGLAHALVRVMRSTPETLSHTLSMFYTSEDNLHSILGENSHCVFCSIRKNKKEISTLAGNM